MNPPKPPGMPKVPPKASKGAPPPKPPNKARRDPSGPFNLFNLDEPDPSSGGQAGGLAAGGAMDMFSAQPGSPFSGAGTSAPTPASPPPLPAKKAPKQIVIKRALIGNILVDNGLLTPEQQAFCLRMQAEPGPHIRFGEIAVKQGFLSPAVLKQVLLAQKSHVSGVKKEQSRLLKLPGEVEKVKSELQTSSKSGSGVGIKQLYKWLKSAFKHGASDLHVMTGEPLVLRHMGRLIRSKDQTLNKEIVTAALTSVLDQTERQTLKVEHSVIKCFDLPEGGRVRASIFKNMKGLNGTFRLIPDKPPFLVTLNLPSALAKFTTYAQGLVLITGPIGCGKTSTMAALIDIINQERKDHIITIEHPCEFVHNNRRSLVTQRQVGLHTESYSNALRAALREDPDVIAVGEMNDLETARLTVSAAETGHLVFATLHTENAVRSINRVLDIFPPDEQNQVRALISESLRGVISQHLVPREDAPGRIPVVELLFTTPAMRNLIREQKVYQLPNAIKMSRDIGNQSLSDHAEILLKEGQISQKTYERIIGKETS